MTKMEINWIITGTTMKKLETIREKLKIEKPSLTVQKLVIPPNLSN